MGPFHWSTSHAQLRERLVTITPLCLDSDELFHLPDNDQKVFVFSSTCPHYQPSQARHCHGVDVPDAVSGHARVCVFPKELPSRRQAAPSLFRPSQPFGDGPRAPVLPASPSLAVLLPTVRNPPAPATVPVATPPPATGSDGWVPFIPVVAPTPYPKPPPSTTPFPLLTLAADAVTTVAPVPSEEPASEILPSNSTRTRETLAW